MQKRIVGSLRRARSRGALEDPRQFAITLDDVARVGQPQHVGQAHVAVDGVVALDQSPALGGEFARYEAKACTQRCGRVRLLRRVPSRPAYVRRRLAAWGASFRCDGQNRDQPHSSRGRHIDARRVGACADIKIIVASLAAIIGHQKSIGPKAKANDPATLILATVTEVSHFAHRSFRIERMTSLNSRFRADLCCFHLAASLRTVTRWDRCTIELRRIELTQIDATMASPVRSDIF